MNDEVLTRNTAGELEVRVVQTNGDTNTNKEDVFTRDSQGRLAMRVTGVGGGSGGASTAADVSFDPSGLSVIRSNNVQSALAELDDATKDVQDSVSVLKTAVDLGVVGDVTVVVLDELIAVENLDGRPSNKEAGATVLGNNGVVGIINSVDNENGTADILTVYVGGTSSGGADVHGIRGDYSAQYGIEKVPDEGIAKLMVGTNNIQVNAGIQLKVQGNSNLIQIASTDTHQTVSTTDFVLAYADGEYWECDVYWQPDEPEDNGQDRYQLWQNGQGWQFRSNDTGNVWRPATNTHPFLDVHFTDGVVTRVDASPYVLLNPDSIDSLPEQDGNAGKFLKTDGVSTSWANLDDIGSGIVDFDMDENGNYFRLYESGWCEQGGIITKSSASTANQVVTLPYKFCGNKYNVQLTPIDSSNLKVIGDPTKRIITVGSSESWQKGYWSASGFPYGYELKINPSPADATVVLSAPRATQDGNAIIAPVGSVVSYSVMKDGYNTINDTFTMGSSDSALTITLGEGSLYIGAQLKNANGENVAYVAFFDETHNNWIALPYARYRSFNKWATSTGATGMDLTTYTSGTVTESMTDEQLNAIANDVQTGTYRTDFLLNLDPTGEKYLAAYSARNCLGEGVGVVVDGVIYYPQLPNINTVMRAFRVKSTLDQYDPTIGEYVDYTMKGWSFGGKNYCWSSSENSSNYALYVSNFGYVSNLTKTTEYGVLPVFEIPAV